MRRLLRYLKGYEKETVLAPLFKMLEACFELLVPLVVAALVDTGIGRGDVPFIWGQFGILVLLAAVGLAASATAQYFAAKSALGYGTALRRDLFHHINTLSYSELDGVGTPTLVTRMTSDVNQLQNGVNMTLRLLLRCPFIVLGALLMSLTISVPMTLWFLGVTALITLVIVLVMRVTVPRYHEAQNTLDKVTLLTRENYAGARVVRAFSRQQDEIDVFTATNDKLKKVQTAAGRISALLNPATYVIVNLGILAVLLRGGQFVDAGTLTQGQIIALISYLNQILTNLLRAADLVITITRAVASGIRVNELLNTATTMADPAAPELAPAAGAPAIAFEDVSFTYRGAGAPSLQGVGFSAEPVETAGRNFSGGQRQRLTIARALVGRPAVLILDDSSSALDFATDAALRRALREKTDGMTVVIVSQRAAAVQRADEILVLDDGALVGCGEHAALLDSCPVYKEICLSQLSREEVEKTL